MNTNKYTPGPWMLAGTANGYQFHIWPESKIGVTTQKIATVNHLSREGSADRYGGINNSEAEANARAYLEGLPDVDKEGR